MGLKMVSNKNKYLCRDTYRVTAKTVKHFEGTWESDFGYATLRNTASQQKLKAL